jgi:hypothetical protein
VGGENEMGWMMEMSEREKDGMIEISESIRMG